MEPDFQALAETLERMTDGFVFLDRGWVYRYVNQRAAALFGRTPEELVGRNIWEEFPEGVGQPFDLAYREARDTQKPVFFEDYYAPWDRWFENRVFPSAEGLGIFFSEITERKRAEEALRESESRFRAVCEAGPLGLALVGPDGRIDEANPGLATITGLERGALTGTRLDRWVADADAPLLATARRALSEGGRARPFDARVSRATGDHLAGRFTLTRVERPNGSPRFDLVTVEDVSAQRIAERELREAQRREAVGRLAAGVAHDFNNLLTIVVSLAELVRSELPPDLPSGDDLAQIIRAAERGAGLTRQLLAFGRQRIFEPKVVSVASSVREVERLLGRLLPENVVLVAPPVPHHLWIRVDEGQLQQALVNLVLNARDALEQGGRITLEALQEAAGQPCIRVTDTGEGMSGETLRRVREAYFTTKAPGRGSGLGLAMVADFMEEAGGTLEIDSAPGRGTQVRLRFPSVDDQPEPATPSPEGDPVALAGVRALVVEDERLVRSALLRVLQRVGVQAYEARHGEDALLSWEREDGHIDVLITDVVMPVLGGAALARRLRERRPDLPVLFVSGYAAGALHTLPGEGAVGYVEKPFTTEALLAALRRILGRSQELE